jgi:hypothetical protein
MRLGGRWFDWILWGAASALPGYGYRLWRVLLAAAFVVGLGVPVYLQALGDGRLVRPDSATADVRHDAVLYSLDVVLPAVSLGAQERWTRVPAADAGSAEPKLDALWLTLWLQRAAGWYLAGVAALSVAFRAFARHGR